MLGLKIGKRERERGIKEGFLEEVVREPVLKFQ